MSLARQTLPDEPRISVETPADVTAARAVVAAAFGSGRFAKTAERLREGSRPTIGFVARDSNGELVGSVHLWPIVVGEQPALFLGPIAVSQAQRRGGLGAALVQACLDHAEAAGRGVLLVGDAPYFGRFGFQVVSDVRMPGPVDRSRILWRGLGDAPSGQVRVAAESRSVALSD